MQSERFFAALKGHGATSRLVLLPHESHGYRARESILHTYVTMPCDGCKSVQYVAANFVKHTSSLLHECMCGCPPLQVLQVRPDYGYHSCWSHLQHLVVHTSSFCVPASVAGAPPSSKISPSKTAPHIFTLWSTVTISRCTPNPAGQRILYYGTVIISSVISPVFCTRLGSRLLNHL